MNPFVLNLILSASWFAAGVGVIVWQQTTGDTRLTLHFGDATFSMAWPAFILSAWNLFRWSQHRRYREPEALDNWHSPLESKHRKDGVEPEPDPTFAFGDNPPAATQQTPPGAAPGTTDAPSRPGTSGGEK